jgi:hypothetical protein
LSPNIFQNLLCWFDIWYYEAIESIVSKPAQLVLKSVAWSYHSNILLFFISQIVSINVCWNCSSSFHFILQRKSYQKKGMMRQWGIEWWMHYGISTTPCLWRHVLTSTTPCLWKCIFGTNFLFNEFAKKKLQKKGWWDNEALNDGCTMGTNGKYVLSSP